MESNSEIMINSNTVRIPYESAETKDKICPFQSTPDRSVACSSQCKLYRADKPKFECPFQELNAISFNTRGLRPR